MDRGVDVTKRNETFMVESGWGVSRCSFKILSPLQYVGKSFTLKTGGNGHRPSEEHRGVPPACPGSPAIAAQVGLAKESPAEDRLQCQRVEPRGKDRVLTRCL